MTDYDISIPVGNTQPYRIRQALQQELGMTAYNDERTVYGLTRPMSPGEDQQTTAPAGHKLTTARIEIADRTAHLSGTSTSRKRIMPVLKGFECVDDVVEEKPRESWLSRFLKRYS